MQITLPVPSCITNVHTIIKCMELRTGRTRIEVLICPQGSGLAGRPNLQGQSDYPKDGRAKKQLECGQPLGETEDTGNF